MSIVKYNKIDMHDLAFIVASLDAEIQSKGATPSLPPQTTGQKSYPHPYFQLFKILIRDPSKNPTKNQFIKSKLEQHINEKISNLKFDGGEPKPYIITKEPINQGIEYKITQKDSNYYYSIVKPENCAVNLLKSLMPPNQPLPDTMTTAPVGGASDSNKNVQADAFKKLQEITKQLVKNLGPGPINNAFNEKMKQCKPQRLNVVTNDPEPVKKTIKRAVRRDSSLKKVIQLLFLLTVFLGQFFILLQYQGIQLTQWADLLTPLPLTTVLKVALTAYVLWFVGNSFIELQNENIDYIAIVRRVIAIFVVALIFSLYLSFHPPIQISAISIFLVSFMLWFVCFGIIKVPQHIDLSAINPNHPVASSATKSTHSQELSNAPKPAQLSLSQGQGDDENKPYNAHDLASSTIETPVLAPNDTTPSNV